MRPPGKRSKHYDGPGAFGHCRTCGEPLRFLLTHRGRLMPTDAANVDFDATHFDPQQHSSHFFTCRQGDLWRKPWKEKAPHEAGP